MELAVFAILKLHYLQWPKPTHSVDLAPMVDLGFILLTFFVFTAAITQPMAMNLRVPNDKDDAVQDEICESCALTLLGKANQIWYDQGTENYKVENVTEYSARGVRSLLQKKKKMVGREKGPGKFVLIIKPSEESNFKNLIDIVDECGISLVPKYYIDEIKPADLKWLSKISKTSL